MCEGLGLFDLESTDTRKEKKNINTSATRSSGGAILRYNATADKFYIYIKDIKYYLDDEYTSTVGQTVIYRKAGLDYSEFVTPAEDWERRVRSEPVTPDHAKTIDKYWSRYKPGIRINFKIQGHKIIIL